MPRRTIAATAAGLAVALLAVGAGSLVTSKLHDPALAALAARPAGSESSRVLPFSGTIVRRVTSRVFDFLITGPPSGFGCFRNTLAHFDVISRTIIFVDGAKADSSDLAVGQTATVFFQVDPYRCGFNAVAKRVNAHSAPSTGSTASSAMTALSGKYEYVKVLPKDPGWHSPTPKKDWVGARLLPDGTTVEVAWTLWTGIGCRDVDNSGRSHSVPVGDDMVTTLTPNRTFHAVDTQSHQKGTRYHRSEVSGQFAADGSYVMLRLRQKLDIVMPGGRTLCDGRWLSVRAPLRERYAPAASVPKPKP